MTLEDDRTFGNLGTGPTDARAFWQLDRIMDCLLYTSDAADE